MIFLSFIYFFSLPSFNLNKKHVGDAGLEHTAVETHADDAVGI